MSDESYAFPIPPEVIRQEQLQQFIEGALAPVDIQEGLKTIAEKASLVAADVSSALKHARNNPHGALAALVGVAAVAASMAPSLQRRLPTSAEEFAAFAATYDTSISVGATSDVIERLNRNAVRVPTVPHVAPDAIPNPGDISIPMPAEQSIAHARMGTATATIELDTPFPQLKPTRPLVDGYPAIPAFGKESPLLARDEKPSVTFRAYEIKPGDTLSDITTREVFKGRIAPYRSDGAGGAHFSEEFCDAAKEIAIENLAVGSVTPPEITPDGNVIGLTPLYNENNADMTQEQVVHQFVLKVNAAIQANPGDRSVLRDLFDNEISSELIPHVLRYLVTADTIYIPNYDLPRTSQQKPLTSAALTDTRKEKPITNSVEKGPDRQNSKYFNEFGARRPR